MDKLNRAMDEQLEKKVADLTAHNDETGDGKLDAADLKAQLNRIEAQLELQDQQNRRIMRNQKLRMTLSVVLTLILLISLAVFSYFSHNAYVDVMEATQHVNGLAETLQGSLASVDPEALDSMMQDLPVITEQLKQVDVDSLNQVLEALPTLLDDVNKLKSQVETISGLLGSVGALFGS